MNIMDHFSGWSQFAAGVVPVSGCWLIAKRYRKSGKTRGSATWMTLWQAHRAGLLSAIGNKRSSGPGLVVGDWKRRLLLPVYYRGDGNILTVGAPGSMKGTGSLIPNALKWPFLFLSDPGGEITAVCIKAWRQRGYNVHIINPWGLYENEPHNLKSSGFNPLDVLDPLSDSFEDDALWLAKTMLPGGKNGNATSEFFEGKAFGIYHALIIYNKTSEPPENQHLVQVREYVRGTLEEWAILIGKMIKSPNNIVAETGRDLKLMMVVPKSLIGMIATMEVATKWLDSSRVRETVTRSGVRFADLKGRGEDGEKLKGAVFSCIIALQYKDSHAALARLAIACTLIIAQRGEMEKDRPRMLVMIDEFASLKRIDMVVAALNTLRRYRVWFHLAVQTLGQIKDIYDEEGLSQVEIGCELRQYFASWDKLTSEHVSAACGTATVSEAVSGKDPNIVGRQLAFREEVTQIRRDEQIVFFGNLPPAKMKIRPYWQRPELRGTFYDNPYHGKTLGLQITWPLQWIAGRAVRSVAGFKGPLVIISLLMAAALIGGLQ